LEVVVWNDVYLTVSDLLVSGRVVEVRGTIDTRGDSLRATAQKVRVPSANRANGGANGNGGSTLCDSRAAKASADEPAILLQFSRTTTSEELREVRELLASSPGQRRVQLLFDRPNGPLRVDAGSELRVDLTDELEQK